MRVAIDARKIADYGIGTYIRGLLRGLEASAPADEEYVILAPAGARPLIPARFAMTELDTPRYSVRELFTVGRAAERSGAKLLHVPHYVVPFTSLPVVTTIHDLIHLRHRNPAARIYARLMLRRAVKKSARILTVTEAVRSDLEQRLRCQRDQITVTPNGIDEELHQAEASFRVRRYFLYAGNDKPHKNVQRLVDALALARQTLPDLTLILAGAPFERFADRPGVLLPGFMEREELIVLMRTCIALVLPSVEEGFGLPAAEAMASGTAVITSRAAALLEVTGDAALHVEASSTEEWAAAMIRLASDEGQRIALARRGIEQARRFTWVGCAERTRRAYQAALRTAVAP